MKAKDIMLRVSVDLLDSDHVRWPLDELAHHIEDAVKAIIVAKPSASSGLMELTLAKGTKQAVPDNVVQLLDVVRNIEGANGAAGRMIRSVSRAELDANAPRWHDPAYVPFRREVRHFVFDELLPKNYFVFPGNDGTGRVEAAVSKLPPLITELQDGDVTDIETWDVEVGIDDQYQPAVQDYVLYRANSKEDTAADPGKAVRHFQAFATAIGIQSQVESSTSPGRRK
jgi:hypothetical protein